MGVSGVHWCVPVYVSVCSSHVSMSQIKNKGFDLKTHDSAPLFAF